MPRSDCLTLGVEVRGLSGQQLQPGGDPVGSLHVRGCHVRLRAGDRGCCRGAGAEAAAGPPDDGDAGLGLLAVVVYD
jgi:hypothetical protein